MIASIRRSALAVGMLMSLMSGTALADPTTFSVNPGAIGVAGPTVPNVNYVDFSYVSLVNQTATNGAGTFNEQGAGFFSSYRFPTLSDVVPNSGINTNYQLYGVFTGSGTVAPTIGTPGGQTATFSNFSLRLFVDPNKNTTITASPAGTVGGTVSVGNTADDILVGQSSALISGESHAFPGLAWGISTPAASTARAILALRPCQSRRLFCYSVQASRHWACFDASVSPDGVCFP